MMSIGITGGMGCGKSTVAKLMEKKGFERIDSDALVREKVLTTPAVCDAIRARFGATVMTPDGAVDRVKLGARVFANEADLAWLEDATHPHVFALWRAAFAEAKRDVVVEAPLLFEKNLENWFDFTVCVACAPAQQLARLEQRGLPHALAEQRISKQLPLARKIELADFVLWNDGSAEFLENQVDHLVNALLVAR